MFIFSSVLDASYCIVHIQILVIQRKRCIVKMNNPQNTPHTGHRRFARLDAHSSTEPENKVQGTLLLDVVVGEGASVLQLLPCKDETLLVRRNSLLVLDLGLDILNSVRWLHLQSDGLASESLDKDLHPSAQPQDQVQSALLLDVVVRKCAPIFQLLPSKDETLLVRGNALLVLNLRLHVLNGVGRFHLQGDSLASQGLDKDLHSSAQSQDQVQGALLLDVVVGEGAAVLQLLPSKDETLLIRGNALLVLDLCLHILDSIRRLHFQRDSLPSQSLHKDLHLGLLLSEQVLEPIEQL